MIGCGLDCVTIGERLHLRCPDKEDSSGDLHAQRILGDLLDRRRDVGIMRREDAARAHQLHSEHLDNPHIYTHVVDASHRKAIEAVEERLFFPKGAGHRQPRGKRVTDVRNADINRDLQILKRAFILAMGEGRLGMRPGVPRLEESQPRAGFFEREQLEAVCRHLSNELQSPVRFVYLTGWRMASEVLPLEWRRVDMARGRGCSSAWSANAAVVRPSSTGPSRRSPRRGKRRVVRPDARTHPGPIFAARPFAILTGLASDVP